MQDKKDNIDKLSLTSLKINMYANGNLLANATGFVVDQDSKSFLITNWHNLSGRDLNSNKPLSLNGGLPDEVEIIYRANNEKGWLKSKEPLQDSNGENLWIEHKKKNKENKPEIDLVALPLNNIQDDVEIHSLDLKLSDTDVVIEPATIVSIIGYPLNLVGDGNLPIWKTGHIASEPSKNYENRPVILIDATTRTGMSGSPVIYKAISGYRNSLNQHHIIGGNAEPIVKFIGVYSGRLINNSNKINSELGLVWRPSLIKEILNI